MAKATTAKKTMAKPKVAVAAKKVVVKKTVEAAKAVKKVETKVAAGAATEKKEIDKMVAAIKEQAADMKPKTAQTGKKGGFGSIIGAIVLIALVGLGGSLAVKQIRLNKAKAGIRDTITKLAGGMVLKDVTEFKEESGVYKFSFLFEEYPDQPFTSYMSTDGKLFFVEGYATAELEAAPVDPAAAEGGAVSSCENVDKNAAPELAAYIVSQCPYGMQMQQVMLEAIAQAPELASNFKVRYFFDEINDDGTVMAMHGEEEAIENLRQICIREEQAAKYWDYVDCYANGGESATCLSENGIAAAGVDACMKDINRGIAWAKEDNALAAQHMVQGSPTLVLNNAQQVSESGFGGRNANGLKSIVCCSSDNALPFCAETLSSATVAASGDCN